MKKYFYLIAVAFLSLLTFNACSSDSPEEELPPKEEPEQPDTPVNPDNPSTSDNVILSENTILLTDSIDKYVTNPVTGTTLNLDASIDEAELPEVGQVLLYGNVSEKFPLGFLGKVKDVVKSSSGYEVITEPVSLEEAFDKLYINETIALTSDEESQQNSRSTEFRLSSWHPQGYTGLECRWHTDFPIVPNVEGGWKVGSTSISGSLSGSVDGGFAMGANLLCLIDIDKKASKESYIKIAMGLRTSFGNKINLKGELTEEYTKELKKFKLAKPFMLSLQGAAIHIILHPAIVLSAFMKYEGKMELDFSQYADYEWEAVYLYEHGIGEFSIYQKDDKDIRTTINKFSIDGSIDMGFSADFGMEFFNNKDVACNIKIAAGPSLAAKLSYDGVGGNLYEKLKDNKIFITACKIKVNGGVQIDVFKKDDGEANMGVAFFNFEKLLGKREYYLFPEFKEKNALWKSNNQILAEYDVSRDLLFPVQLGMRLMDKDKKTLKDDVSLIEYHYKKEESPTLLSTTFDNVNSKKDYYVCPIVELPLFGKVEASPVTKINAKQDTCHIDFTIEYPKYSDSYRMNGRDEASCEAALYPIYENENQRKGIVGTEAILYKDGKEVARSSYQWLGRNIISKLFKREELLIDYENYIARPKDGRWQVSMAFKKLDEYGDTITCVTDVVKDIDLKYDTKPAMIIYRCDIRGCDSHSMEDEHSFLIDMNCFVRGTFWCKTTIGNGSNEVTNGEVIVVRDDFSFGGSWGVNYTNYDVPNRLVMKYIDYSGRMVESNSVPIQTDVNGCVIDSHYEDDSELSQYESRWSFD